MKSALSALFALFLSLVSSLLTRPAQAQVVSNQSFEITSSTTHPTVGDTVTLSFRVRLDERDLLFDTVPRPIGAVPQGVRILAVEKLQRTPDRIFHGHARLAYYRPGHQPVPVFGLPFMRAVKGVQRATLVSDSAFVDIVPLLPAGNPSLKDIASLERTPGLPVWPFIAGLILLGGLFAFYRRRRKAGAHSDQVKVPAPPEEAAQNPYEIAVQQLQGIERENWPAHGFPARHYAAVTDTLRDYLEAAEDVPARERTSAEVLWTLPPHLTQTDLRQRLQQIFDEADRVKFARIRPEPIQARDFLLRSRALLEAWHQSHSAELSDAIR
ncbi:MAG: LPXTG cell wall anchor domain-containing protein [Gemmatimonadales bacterium]